MKTLLTLLLLIPSLSWGEVIWLSCQEYENTTYKDGEVFTKERSDGYKSLYGLHNDDPVRLFIYPDKRIDLDEGGNYLYRFKETTRVGVVFFYYLNRYTYGLSSESFYEGKRRGGSSSNCEIIERIL